jgi:putative colanic acid biosynthesis acetyltransferase WcaB
LGDYVSIHNRALISGRSQLHDHCEIGGNATVLAGAVVETDARVGAGSVLLKRAPAGKMMMGVPAKVFDF